MKDANSLINWGETKEIFNENLHYVVEKLSNNNYCDNEVD